MKLVKFTMLFALILVFVASLGIATADEEKEDGEKTESDDKAEGDDKAK
jgi:hypothetical protein